MSEKATVTNYSYDTAGNYLQSITNPLGKQVAFTVDQHGNPLTVTDPGQNVTRFTYDDLDALKTVRNANNLLTEYNYDQAGNLLSVTQKDGLTLELLSTTSSVYNELGLVTQVIDSMHQITEYRYDQNGNLVYIKTVSGQEAWLTYDTHDRLANVQYLYEQAGQMLIFSYDKNSNRTNVVHKTGNLADPDNMVLQERYSYSYEYDALNRATRVRLPNGRTVNYTYNPVSQVTSIGNSEVSTVNYSYDYTGLNTAVKEDISGATSYIYDELGRITKSMRGKGTVALTTHVQYDALGQITRYQTVNSSGVVAEHVYEYDDNGNRIRDKKLNGSYVVYKYDQVNQLLAEEYFSAQGVSTRRIGYTYSLQGNRLAKEITEDGNTGTTYGYNAANELTNIDGKTISYEDGNQLHTGSNSLEFNALGQLLKVYTIDGQQLLEQYEYNADGLRIAKLDGSGNVLEQYIYNGSKLAYVTDGGNKLLYYFTRNASGTLLSFVDCTGEEKVAYWYVTDAHGNVVGLTNASGELVVTYSYDAWGNELSSTGSVTTANGAKLIKDANPFRYSGYYYDSTTGLYYLNARYYSPELGRFLSRDPVQGTMVDGLSLNKYLYARNNAVNYIDDSGMAFEDDIAPAFNEVRENPYANLPDSTPLVSYSLSRALPDVVASAFVSAVDSVIEFNAEKLPSRSWVIGDIGKPRIATGTTYAKHTGNILIKKVAAVGAVSVALNVIGGIRNVEKYGWREGLGRTGFDVAGTFASASIGAFVAGLICAPLMPVAAATVGGVIGFIVGRATDSALNRLKIFVYGH